MTEKEDESGRKGSVFSFSRAMGASRIHMMEKGKKYLKVY